jgi:Fe-S-cluster containining protein|tara:strand:- start:1153 stop:1635 length:483 start_codon:yes stop_codon:yes gene_type:complete
MDLVNLKLNSKLKRKENTKFFKRLKTINSKKLDKSIHNIHEKVFSCTDCLKCANCCTTTGPLFTDRDITRISRHLKIKPSDFTHKYLKIDEDFDYILKKVPCEFLLKDNSCSIYDVRPKACREYPHTDRIKQHQILEITQKNIEICPAVYNIIEDLKKEL